MIQIWIIRSDMHPAEAIANGGDRKICFNCPQRKQRETGKRGCYVSIKAPASIYRKLQSGTYETLSEDRISEQFQGKSVRFGAYGEPVLLPLNLVRKIAAAAANWTGYTHQWAKPQFQGYRAYFMASTETATRDQAQAMGWRTFTVAKQANPQDMVCPASHEFEAKRGYKLTCARCGQCAGLGRTGRSVTIQPHGVGANYAA